MKQLLSVQLLSASCLPARERPYRATPARIQIWPIGLLIVLMLVLLGVPVTAAVFPGSAGIPSAPTSQATYEDWLKATGKPVTSRYNGYKASFATWQTYRLLVYGAPAQVPGNRYDAKSAQYASLGYSYDEIEVTNSLFPDDSPDGKTRSTPWQWVELDMGQSARISWGRLDTRQKEFIKNSGLTYRNNSYGGMTFQSLKMTDKTTVVLAPPSWYLGFALYTNHYLPGSKTKLRYATFCGAGSGDVALSSRIDVINTAGADGKYIIDRGSDYIDISYNIVGSISSFNGLAASQDILYRGAGDSQAWVNGTGSGPWTAARTLRISRQDLAGLGERSFALSGQAWVVSSMGDIKISNVEKTITVRAESQIPAFSANVQISGGIRYFSGQTNSQGRQMPQNPHRFLEIGRASCRERV